MFQNCSKRKKLQKRNSASKSAKYDAKVGALEAPVQVKNEVLPSSEQLRNDKHCAAKKLHQPLRLKVEVPSEVEQSEVSTDPLFSKPLPPPSNAAKSLLRTGRTSANGHCNGGKRKTGAASTLKATMDPVRLFLILLCSTDALEMTNEAAI